MQGLNCQAQAFRREAIVTTGCASRLHASIGNWYWCWKFWSWFANGTWNIKGADRTWPRTLGATGWTRPSHLGVQRLPGQTAEKQDQPKYVSFSFNAKKDIGVHMYASHIHPPYALSCIAQTRSPRNLYTSLGAKSMFFMSTRFTNFALFIIMHLKLS